MTEDILYQKYIKKYLLRQGLFVFRVEHMRMPDVYTFKDDKVHWYELKVINSIPRNNILEPDWRPGQLSWIAEHKARGGKAPITLILWFLSEWRMLEPKQNYTMKEWNDVRKYYI